MSSGMVEKALSSLGKGFDLTCDFRLKYSKGGDDDGRLIVLNESEKRTLHVPGFGPINDVPIDIRCDKGDRLRYQTDILDFNKMSEFMNQKSSVSGKVPSGMFNAMFGLQSQSWGEDASKIKYLGLDGYFINLFNLHIDRYPLLLSHHVSNAVPTSWDPPALSRFIEKYGTHIIVGLSIGGQDVVLVRQDRTSNVEPTQLKQHLDELGDQLFTGACSLSNTTKQSKHNYNKQAPEAFNVFNSQPPLPLVSTQISPGCSKDGITVICSRRGGDLSAASHCEWLLTVPSKPDAIHFTFIPITSLLKGVPGKGFLSHAINLYLRYKPPIADLQYFLDFQTHKLWAPMHNDLSLGPTTNRSTKSPSLHFNMLMGPKLYLNTTQVIVGKLPVTGMRLYLEGMKCNRLAIHLQHLSNPPIMLQKHVHNIDVPIWRGSEDEEESRCGYIEEGKISYVCTAPVEYEEELGLSTSSRKDMYIVTGAQLHIKKHDDNDSSSSSSSSSKKKKKKKVLHLRLRFTRVVGAFSVQSIWDRGESDYQMEFSSGHKFSGGLLSAISAPFGTSSNNNNNSNVVVDKKKQSLLVNMDSSVFPSGPPVPVQTQKLLKYVDMSHRCKGPQDSPGHWLVTGAKLDLDKGKIRLHVKFSLLNICSPSPSPSPSL